MNVRLFAITRQGLIAIGVSVAALWTCVGLEAATRHQTLLDSAASVRTLEHLRNPSTGPAPTSPGRLPFSATQHPRQSVS